MTKIEVLMFDPSAGFDATRTPCKILARQELPVDKAGEGLDARISATVSRLGQELTRIGYAPAGPVGLYVREVADSPRAPAEVTPS